LEGFIDRLAGLLRSLFSDERGAQEGRGAPGGQAHRGDPDLDDAWQELDEFMRTGSNERVHARGTDSARARGGHTSPPPRQPEEALRKDYANLEVPFGADIDTVRRSYKSLMMKYHPDKHAGDPQKQKIALEITKKVNESFERIRARQE
jgi:DnaJ-domain-containing protein 1